ncbi:uncharacterized protein LOC143291656 [Babylonia areolata]|uniref:uncharacterized protein LOC143291656 n=1 Tax=Babylonia areolata TaxID=304850 RepID=UPI003FD07B1F
MGAKAVELSIVCIFCSAISGVMSASMQALVTPNPAIFGRKLTVKCLFSVETNEEIQNVQLSSKTEDTIVASLFNARQTKPAWNSGQFVDSLRARGGDVFGSFSSGFLSLELNPATCNDNQTMYQCRIQSLVGNIGPTKDSETTVNLQVYPEEPNPISVTSRQNVSRTAPRNVTQSTVLSFTCTGKVGDPPGNFSWFRIGGGMSGRESFTGEAGSQVRRRSQEGCYYTQTSSLSVNMTRTEEGQPVEFLCMVNHPLIPDASQRDCSHPNISFCSSSGPINVLYPVTLLGISDPLQVSEGTSYVSVQCLVDGNPKPHLIEWRKEGEDEVISTNYVLSMQNLTLDSTGTYECTAYNTIDGVTYQANGSVTLNVVTTVVPPTTTTTSPPPTTTTTSRSDPDKAGLGEKEIIIIVVVLVVLVVVIAIVVIVFIVCRRSGLKTVGESTETYESTENSPDNIAMQPASEVVDSDETLEPVDNSISKNDDGLMYADLQFDNKPRSRKPLAIDDSQTEYADISMPQV